MAVNVSDVGRIARKNVHITFQKNSVVVDEYRNHLREWSDYFSCYAYASTYAAQESGNEVITEERSITFHVRYCPELAHVTSTGYRIIFNGESYDIESVDMMNYQGEEIRFKCRREIR